MKSMLLFPSSETSPRITVHQEVKGRHEFLLGLGREGLLAKEAGEIAYGCRPLRKLIGRSMM